MNTNPTEHQFTSHDGTSLFYRAWRPEQPHDKALILIHRGHEHSGRWQEMVEKLNLPDTAVIAWDQRGHGRSPGPRGGAPNLATVIRDLDGFVRHVEKEHGLPVENMIVLAHSVGAVVASAWVHDYAPKIRGLILGTPAFRVKLYVPLAVPALRLKQRLLGPGIVKSYVRASALTHDAAQAAQYSADPAIFREIAVNILLDLFDTGKRVVEDAAAIRVPVLMFVADGDWVVRSGPQREFFSRLGSQHKELQVLRGFRHAIFHEARREEVFSRVEEFAKRLFSRPAEPRPSLLRADEHGFTKLERDELELTRDCLAARAQRFFMKTIGRLSEGISLGWSAGFDSGRTLDYVYRNEARGTTPLGRFIDAQYLGSPGWAGIRWRGAAIQRLIGDAIQHQTKAGSKARLVDIACGGGRYVLNAIAERRELPVEAVLRDYQQPNLDKAAETATSLGIRDRITLVRGDAFDRASLASLDAPNIAVVSGLYELFPDNDRVLESLRGLADSMRTGGLVIYTNQPWHPQLKFIAHVLSNREGQPWVMRRRTQEEMDEIVSAAGFEKVSQETDPDGIFTVSVARRK